MIIVIDNYDSFTWNLVHYIREVGAETEVHRNDKITVDEVIARKPSGIVLSPGPCTPNEAGICLDLVRQLPFEVPLLGVCLGHQSIGQALGGEVVTAREIRHGKRSTIAHSGEGLYKGLPQTFDVVRYHSLAVAPQSLSDDLVADAHTDDGEIMSFHHKTRPIYGIQFHPESILTEHGHAMLKTFVEVTQ